jgi:hypothetical protein
MTLELEKAVRCFHWMARRYADGRASYAPGSFNDHVRKLISAGIKLETPLYARDGMGRAYDGLNDEDVAAAEADMPKGHTIPLADDEGRLAAMHEAIEKTIADLHLFANSFDDGSASKDFCIGLESRLRSALLKAKGGEG